MKRDREIDKEGEGEGEKTEKEGVRATYGSSFSLPLSPFFSYSTFERRGEAVVPAHSVVCEFLLLLLLGWPRSVKQEHKKKTERSGQTCRR